VAARNGRLGFAKDIVNWSGRGGRLERNGKGLGG
jgi:hypothetical protein